VFEENRIYSNNFNSYAADSDVKPSFPFPVGTGAWIAGGNHHTVRGNYIWDNWRRGTMLFSVPDSLICGPAADGNEQAGCDSKKISTSHYNSYYDNHMGVSPDGTAAPNGVDFWWDDFTGSRGNCWYRNSGPKPITTSPASLPNCDDGKDPALSLGKGNPANEGELVSCVAAFETRDFDESSPCPWLHPPTKPQRSRAGAFGPAFAPLEIPPAPARPSTLDPVPLSQATCADWLAADAAGRATLVHRVTGFAGGVVNAGAYDVGTGATLTDARATALYDSWCAHGYASGFLLYKLYTWSAGFSPQLDSAA
jgi:hypothetical protein